LYFEKTSRSVLGFQRAGRITVARNNFTLTKIFVLQEKKTIYNPSS